MEPEPVLDNDYINGARMRDAIFQALKLASAFGVAAALTHGTRAVMKRVHREDYHEWTKKHPRAISAYPSLCLEISQLANLEQERRFHAIMQLIDEVAEYDEMSRPGNEFKIARSTASIRSHLVLLLKETQEWKNNHLFNEKRIAEEDTIPTLERQLENILHNYINKKTGSQ